MKNTILAFFCVLAVTGWTDETSRPWSERLPTNEEIFDYFRTNTVKDFHATKMYHLIEDLQKGTNRFEIGELERVRSCFLTNVFLLPHKIIYNRLFPDSVDRTGADFQRWALSWTWRFPFVTNDVSYYYAIADFIGTVQPKKADRQKFYRDMMEAWEEDKKNGNISNVVSCSPIPFRGVANRECHVGPCRKACNDQYRLELYDERYFTEHRHRLLNFFGGAVQMYMAKMPNAERPAFRSNIVERARLTPSEEKDVFWGVH